MSWIISNNISFRGVETPAFRRLLHIASISKGKAAKDCVRRKAVSRDIRLKAIKAKDQLKEELRENTSRVSISLDGWTSPNGYAFVGIVVHYISNDYKLHQEVLDFRIIEGSHSGATYAKLVWAVLEEYRLLDKVSDKTFLSYKLKLTMSPGICNNWRLSII